MDEYVELPDGAEVGDQAAVTVTRFHLEGIIHHYNRKWYRVGRDQENGHATEAEAEAEWDGLDELERTDYYTDHRIVRADTTVTLTVVQKG